MVDDENRSNNELIDVPSITLDRDDVAERRQNNRSPRTEKLAIDGGLGGFDTGLFEDSSSGNGFKALAGLVFALLAVLAGIAWLHVELQNAQEQLITANGRLDQLEERLASTDTTLTKSDILLADKLNRMDKLMDENKDEIKKLWGVSYDTNRKAIELNRVMNEKQEQALKQLKNQVTDGENLLTSLQVVLGQTTAAAKNGETSALEAVQRMELAQEKISALSADAVNLKQKQTQFEVDSKKRLAALEDTAKSTDVFRRNTQEELRKLREELVRQSAQKSNPSVQ